MKQEVREALSEMGYDEAVVFNNPDFDEAIIGATDDSRAVYDYDAMVKCLAEKDGITELEAAEFIDYNTIRAIPYAGEHAPIIVYSLQPYLPGGTVTDNAIAYLEQLLEKYDSNQNITDTDIAHAIEILKGRE